MGNLILIFLSCLAVIAGIGVVFSKNTLASAISLLFVMLILSFIYAIIGLPFIAAVQLLVYAGAVMVLIVFSIMLLNFNKDEREVRLESKLTGFALAAALVVGGVLIGIFLKKDFPLSQQAFGIFDSSTIQSAGGNIILVSKMIFTKYIFHFEMLSLVLLVALIAALTVAKKRLD